MTPIQQQIEDQKELISDLEEGRRSQMHRRGLIVASADSDVKDQKITEVDTAIEDYNNQIEYQKDILRNLELLQFSSHKQ